MEIQSQSLYYNASKVRNGLAATYEGWGGLALNVGKIRNSH